MDRFIELAEDGRAVGVDCGPGVGVAAPEFAPIIAAKFLVVSWVSLPEHRLTARMLPVEVLAHNTEAVDCASEADGSCIEEMTASNKTSDREHTDIPFSLYQTYSLLSQFTPLSTS